MNYTSVVIGDTLTRVSGETFIVLILVVNDLSNIRATENNGCEVINSANETTCKIERPPAREDAPQKPRHSNQHRWNKEKKEKKEKRTKQAMEARH